MLAIACGGDFRTTSAGSDGGHGDTGGGAGRNVDAGSGGSSAGTTSAGGSSAGTTSAGGADGNGGRGGRGGGHSTGGAVGSGGNPDTGGGTSSGGNGGTGSGGHSTTGGTTGNGGAGGTSHSQLAKDYDQSCQLDGDCTLVGESSDVCTFCGCSNAAINKGDLNKWNDDRSAFSCPPIACPGIPCQTMVASCAKGMCIARKPLVIEAKNYDQTCLTSADCTKVPLGEVCNPCHCSQGAISNTGFKKYTSDRASVECTPAACSVKCVSTPSPTCDLSTVLSGGSGTCTLPTGGTGGTGGAGGAATTN